jgi:hypothetical protein
MANAAFLLLFGALIIWLFASGKLGQMMAVIKTNVAPQ